MTKTAAISAPKSNPASTGSTPNTGTSGGVLGAGGAGSTVAGGLTNLAGAGATDASMSQMMATMAHNTIIGNLASIAESNNNLMVNGTGGVTKVTSNVGRNLKDAAG